MVQFAGSQSTLCLRNTDSNIHLSTVFINYNTSGLSEHLWGAGVKIVQMWDTVKD